MRKNHWVGTMFRYNGSGHCLKADVEASGGEKGWNAGVSRRANNPPMHKIVILLCSQKRGPINHIHVSRGHTDPIIMSRLLACILEQVLRG